MTKTFQFYVGPKEGVAKVYIKLENGVFSAMAESYSCGGQCFDTLLELFKEDNTPVPDLFQKIYDFWKKYHLNDMHAGTPRQEAAIKDKFSDKYPGYEKAVKWLEEINLLYDPELKDRNGKPYKYGSAWLKQDIPQVDLIQIEQLFNL